MAFLSGAPGMPELLVVLLVLVILFGPRKLPELARSLGRIVKDVRSASRDIQDQVAGVGEDASRTPVSMEPYTEIDEDDEDDEADEDEVKRPLAG